GTIGDSGQGWIPNLKVRPQLIAQFPERAALLRTPVVVHVFHPRSSFFRSTRAQVQRNLRLGSNETAVGEEFVCAKLVVLGHAPGDVQHADPPVSGADSIAPMIGRSKISSVAHD